MDQAAGDTRGGPVWAPDGRVPPAPRARRRASPDRTKRQARRAQHTLFAAWGHEPPADQPRERASPEVPAAPLPRLVRGTAQGDKMHPFFAQRETLPRDSRRKDDTSSSGTPRARLGMLPAPWPAADAVHVQPATQPIAHKSVAWPRRSRPASGPSSRAPLRLPLEAAPTAGEALACEAALEPVSEAPHAAAMPAPRPPLAYVGADLALPASAPPIVQHLHAQLSAQGLHTLATRRAPSLAHDALWTDRWRPMCAAHVLGNEANAIYLRDWLRELRVTDMQKRTASRKRGRPRPDSDDEFLPEEAAWFDQFRAPTSSRAAQPLAHCVVLAGPTGVGKTAAVYACAEELGFEVFELYAGMGRRSGKELASAVGQLTRNHMVRSEKRAQAAQAAPAMPPQSLILLDEADLLFDDDAGFWPAVVELVSESRRPVVLTCTDAQALPLADLRVQRILTWAPPPPDVAATYLQLVALSEGYIVSHAAMHTLYTQTRPQPVPLDRTSGPALPTAQLYPYDRVSDGAPAPDLRAALMQLAWLCLHTRAEDVLRGTARPAAPATSAPCGERDAFKALQRVCRAAERRSCADLLDMADAAESDEAVPLPPRGRAHVAKIPTARVPPSCHVPQGARRALPMGAALRGTDDEAGDRAAYEAHACVDFGRARYSRAVHTMLAVLNVPHAEQLPRTGVATEYAPYVRSMCHVDMARQQQWAAQRYDAALWTGRVTRAATRHVLDAEGHTALPYAWLPLGPSERAAVRQTMFLQPI
ncbi:hypothetical protein MCAP1_002329 [Malassezia caprae]|uniref:AAA+ ATPase domain-containing protein n=1 Tax=Malassezia caprae TaxID=1381934 RepID=A0AAF0E777_9BASI|nr:hypothetical protein MCAP1_002329 [Malassezia caprae]